ncbi:F-box/LRR-repeat protein At1g06630-like [Cornus florida]|uniref:F-box/LRR-repeat protein At1g06630-like n=1 Tax=Cornus florida TaxID=4283 RepID=UPI00289A2DBB|nr:F-box/LRR-repeat protein At1g06630-like [Cornus florida]
MVNVPILEYLFIRDYCLPSYVLKNLTSLVKAYVNVGDCWSVEDCWRGELSLCSYLIKAFDYADDGELPLFSNLIRLELNVENCYGWKRLLHLLKSMPSLEYLVLKKLKINKHQCQHNDSKDFKFVEPEVVPCCLSIHVQEIEITGFQGQSCELEQKLIEYFLRNAKVLRKMTINSCNSRTTSRKGVSR